MKKLQSHSSHSQLEGTSKNLKIKSEILKLKNKDKADWIRNGPMHDPKKIIQIFFYQNDMHFFFFFSILFTNQVFKIKRFL